MKIISTLAAISITATAILALTSCSKEDLGLGDEQSDCDGSPYSSKTQFCYANEIYQKCSDEKYDPDNQTCTDGRIVSNNNPNTSSNSNNGNLSSNSNNGTPSSNSNGEWVQDSECRNSQGILFCQWPTGCFTLDPQYTEIPWEKNCNELVSECSSFGALYTGVTGLNESNGWGEGLQCAAQGGVSANGNTLLSSSSGNGNRSSSSSNTWIPNNECKDERNNILFCQWPNGCFSMDPQYDKEKRTCAQMISSCNLDGGTLYTGVTGLNEGNGWGEGLQCTAQGGILANVNITSSSSSGNDWIPDTECKNAQNRILFCQWPNGCFTLDPQYTDIPWEKNCDELVSDCSSFGALYTGVIGLNESNDWGKGLQCTAQGGSTYTP